MNNIFDLTNKVVVITGGSGMLGQKYAETICELNGVPIIIDIDRGEIESVVENLNKEFGPAFGIQSDITSEKSIINACDTILKKYEHIDVLINNAALTVRGVSERAADFFLPLEEYPIEIWDEMVNVNLTGHFICSKIIGREMIKNKSGNIINISSEIGLISPDQRIYEGIKNPYSDGPLNNPPGYSATKAGLIYMTKYLASCWGKYNIRVNTLCPGGVYDGHDEKFLFNYSRLVPMDRMAQKDEYKGAIAFLSSNASSYMTGSVVVIDGGKTCW